MRIYFKNLALVTLCLFLTEVIAAQAGGPYEVTQSVIAGGGGRSFETAFSIEGTIAQHTAGSVASNGPYVLRVGFWQSSFVPTAALISISGRVVTASGRPIGMAHVRFTSPTGIDRQSITGPFGYYKVDDLEAGQAYVVSVVSKGSTFISRIVLIDDPAVAIDIVALP